MNNKCFRTGSVGGLLIGLLVLGSFSISLQAHQPHDPLLVVATSPSFEQDHTLVVATDYLTVSIGVYLPLISTDGGNTLTPLRGIPNQPISSIQFSPNYSADGTILLAGGAGLFKTTDRGVTWAQVAVNGSAAVNSAAFSPSYATDGIVFAITAANVFESTDSAVTFVPAGSPGPLTGALNVIAISPNFTVDGTLAVGTTSDGIFKSTNRGQIYTHPTQSQTLPQINSLVFSPGFGVDQTIFAGTYGDGVYISIDGGVTFAASNAGLTDQNVTSLVLFPGYEQTGSVLVSTALAGVFVSNSHGSSWTQGAKVYRPLSNQTTMHYRTLAAAPTSATTALIYLGMFEGLWSSTNKAQSWTYIDMIPTYLMRELKASTTYPVDRTLLGTSYGGGQLFTASGSANWSFRNTGTSNAYPDADAISPNFDKDQTVAIGVVTEMDLSTNGGKSFARVPGLNKSTYVRAIAFSPNFANDATVLIGTDNRGTGNPQTVTYQGKSYPNQGLFLSKNGGVNWIPTSLGGPAIDNIEISPGFTSDQTAFAASTVSGLYMSTDGGATWKGVFNLASDSGILQVLLSPAFPTDHTVFAATPHSGIYKSINGGMTWAPLRNSVQYTAISFAISPNYLVDQTIYIGTFQSGLIKTTDGGRTYGPTGLAQNFVTALAISSGFATDQTLFAATYRGIFKSTDAGATWAFTNQPNRQESDRQVNILYTGTWTNNPSASASSGFFDSTSVGGSTATAYFFGTGFSWIALMGPKGGSASVTVDGVPVGTASFLAPQTAFQQSVFQSGALSCGPHTVVFTSSSAPNQNGINFDAIDATRAGCGY